jgi:hypothetical protein
MNIDELELTVCDLVNGYSDDGEAGVFGYGGKLDIRPPYQREFIYKDKQRDAVIETVTKDFPLNVMYWAVREDGTYEVIDGQQRTISLCQYVEGEFSINGLAFHNLQSDEKRQILDYKLMVYLCSGTDSEKLAWFRIINIAGEKLTNQELRNAVYSGPWLSAAKPIFSKNNCPAYLLANKYVTGAPIRQEYLETVIEWISNGDVEGYMSKHQHDPNANAEWLYFQSVIAWVKATFNVYRKEMKGLPWGSLYNKHHADALDSKTLESEISALMEDDEVTNYKGVYSYVLTRNERYLSLRTFDDKQKRRVYEKQKGICPICYGHYEFSEMAGDHIVAWSKGGRTTDDNCQMLCFRDNNTKSNQ